MQIELKISTYNKILNFNKLNLDNFKQVYPKHVIYTNDSFNSNDQSLFEELDPSIF
jgi:hypothetical protein